MVDPLAMLAPVAAGPDSDPASPAEAAEQFEALFVRTLLKEVRKSMDSAGLMGGGGGQAAAFSDLMDAELAARISANGGLGLASHIQGHLEGISGTADPTSTPSPSGPVRPVRTGRISSHFGLRTDPIEGGHRHHDGMDFAAPEGTPIFAARAGTVRLAERRGGYGNVVILDHGGGVETRYAHCRDLDVRAGQRVGGGERLGSVGSTGRSTGPHLHFEVRVDGTAVDPASWVGAATESAKTITQVVR